MLQNWKGKQRNVEVFSQVDSTKERLKKKNLNSKL